MTEQKHLNRVVIAAIVATFAQDWTLWEETEFFQLIKNGPQTECHATHTTCYPGDIGEAAWYALRDQFTVWADEFHRESCGRIHPSLPPMLGFIGEIFKDDDVRFLGWVDLGDELNRALTAHLAKK